ncbi:hypothetical protein TD95_004059 [Thielaviopsis punctulata]|uniref:RRM domain-containing protein n=1 Tax=Thielaviopsis punctulata TaxID=72032 RepID=A0A0F4Z8Y5_9PEZI|nr:hypothetical protein TD95_004059 [Thielaviopsis punctulata]
MFIGGLNWETTDESLKDYFSQFGEVLECTVMRDNNTGRSRGFGFLTFKDPKTVNIVMVKEHFLDGKITQIDPKRAIPRDEQEKTSKIFVGGVSQETTDQEFREYFTQFGRVVDATLMMDKNTGRPRGFGFVTFESEAGVENCINTPLEIHGKPIEVKKAQPRGNLREEEEPNRNNINKFRKMDDHSMGGPGNMMGQMGGPNGMSPQVMAQYMQRMQQYFSMMQQQQMAMNRGMGQMNPAVWQNMQQQMMQMQQMQQMQMMGRGQGGPGGMMGGMNPAAMMGNMMGQNAGNRNFNNNNNNAGANANGNDGFDQQGSSNMYNQPQRRFNNQSQGNWNSPNPSPNPNPNNVPNANVNVNGTAADANSLDDATQQTGPVAQGRGTPNSQSFRRVPGSGGQTPDVANAPPANAPTGPKNAGRPGANYRGGGRGGNRGFHPYSR